MTHLSAELLRRHRDEPNALLSVEKEHLLACPRCRALRDEIAANAAFAAEALALPPERLDLERARLSVATRAATPTYAAGTRNRLSGWTPRARWTTAAAAAAVLALGLSLSPVRTTAANFLAIFEPHTFQPIAVSRADIESLRGFPDLSAFGNVEHVAANAQAPQQFSSVLDAMRAAHQVVLHPRYLPQGVTGEPVYSVLPGHSGAFTFSAAKARESAQRNRSALPPMPPNLDGSTLYAAFAPAVVTTYGTGDRRTWLGAHRRLHAHAAGGTAGGFSGFALVQSPAPRIYSTGASVRDILNYILAEPGISPSLAAQIRAIGDPSTTLPIPIPIDKALAQTVFIGGVPALVIGDETGVGSAVVWERGGMVYGVAGPLRESELLAVANSLTQ